MSGRRGRPADAPVRVLCVVARGVEGKGGLERLFYYTREDGTFERLGVAVDYVASRGDATGSRWVLDFPGNLVRYAWRLAARRYDLVHLNLSVSGSAYRKVLLFYVARLFGRKVLVHFHGGGFEHMIDDGRLSTAVILHLFRHADRLVLLGAFWRRLIADRLGLPPAQIDVVNNGCPDFGKGASVPRAPASVTHLLFAGEVAPRKGVDVLVRALAALEARTPAWRCVIAGHGDLPRYRGEARDKGIADKIVMTGWLSADRLHEEMRAADVIVLPSRFEGLPVCLIEGACAGAALVATDEGATRDILHHGENGFIVPLDAEAIADTLAGLRDDPATLAAMQAASRRIYEGGFTIDAMASGLATVYRELAAGRTKDRMA